SRAINRVAAEVAVAAVGGNGKYTGVEPHRKLPRRYVVVVRSDDLAAKIIGPDMAEGLRAGLGISRRLKSSAAAQVAAREQIAGIIRRRPGPSSAEARRSTPHLRY